MLLTLYLRIRSYSLIVTPPLDHIDGVRPIISGGRNRHPTVAADDDPYAMNYVRIEKRWNYNQT
jgi:hypothetical protein